MPFLYAAKSTLGPSKQHTWHQQTEEKKVGIDKLEGT